MTDPTSTPPTRDDGDDVDPVAELVPDPDLRSLAGYRDADDEGDPIAADEVEDLGAITPTEIYEGELEARVPYGDQPDDAPAENLELLTELELRADETADPNVAAEEGLAWVPPTDPPVIPGERGDPEIAAGFGATSDMEPFDADHHASAELSDDERTERVREALRADAATSTLAEGLAVDTDGERVIIGGEVDGIEDEDEVMAVAARVADVGEVISRLRIRALD